MTTDTYQFVKETARKVIIEMGLGKVLLTPENYHLWYEYIIGANTALVKDINALKAAKRPFTEKVNQALYRRHIRNGGSDPSSLRNAEEMKEVREAQEQTEALLKNLLSEVLETSSSAAAYNNNLKAYSSRIAEAEGIAELQSVVRDLLQDTAGMAKSSANLHAKLEQATHEAESLKQKLFDARMIAEIDALTGIRNRRGLDAELEALLETYESDGSRFSVIMVDVDHFKPFNDTYGHQLGDEALRLVAKVMAETVDDDGIATRYGGEEFSVLVPGSGLEGARYMAERIRVCISKIEVPSPDTKERVKGITASLGVAEVREGDTADSVLKRADEALYFAKQSGRNQVKTEAEIIEMQQAG